MLIGGGPAYPASLVSLGPLIESWWPQPSLLKGRQVRVGLYNDQYASLSFLEKFSEVLCREAEKWGATLEIATQTAIHSERVGYYLRQLAAEQPAQLAVGVWIGKGWEIHQSRLAGFLPGRTVRRVTYYAHVWCVKEGELRRSPGSLIMCGADERREAWARDCAATRILQEIEALLGEL